MIYDVFLVPAPCPAEAAKRAVFILSLVSVWVEYMLQGHFKGP